MTGSRLGRVLIVEDDAALRDQLTWALKADFEVVEGSPMSENGTRTRPW